MNVLDKGDLIRGLMNIRDQADAALKLLLPESDDAGCPHPAAAIEDLSTLDDDGQRYRCTHCGEERTTPFSSDED